jgi:hypothetical protein
MPDLHSPRVPLTVQLPAELVQELQLLAREKQVSVDEVVMEACLSYTEPYGWDRCYKYQLPMHPGQAAQESGSDGDDRHPLQPEAKPA